MKMRHFYGLLLFFCGAIALLLPSVSEGVFGYGYGCDGKFGYGYSCSKSKKKEYKKLKRAYKKKSVKNTYRKVKYLKKGTPLENAKYLQARSTYKKYKHLSSAERKVFLTIDEQVDFKAYKRYRGYKKYKKLKKEMGL